MNKITLMKNFITSKAGRQVLQLQKHAPTILTYAGVGGFVVAGVLASRATLKLEEKIDTMQVRINEAKERAEEEGYSKKDAVKDVSYAYIRGIADISALYAPAVILGVASGSAIIGSHGAMQKRNLALAAAYATLEKGFNQYRERVRAELGEEKDLDFRLGASKEVEHYEGKDGKQHQRTIKKATIDGYSQYARFFDELNPNFQKQNSYNLMFLRQKQNYLNDMLLARGHVFLNDVYDELGMDRTSEGAIVGWVISKDGDNFVDFGIYDAEKSGAIDFVNGRESAILLDFNVDGVIFDKI